MRLEDRAGKKDQALLRGIVGLGTALGLQLVDAKRLERLTQ
jgi:hypothetical protein